MFAGHEQVGAELSVPTHAGMVAPSVEHVVAHWLHAISLVVVHAEDMYFPAPHVVEQPVHDAAFVVVEKFVPAVQFVHARFTETEHDVETYVPAEHVLHVEHDVEPYPDANVVPEEHAVQGAYCVDEEYPGLHTHAGRSCVKLPEVTP